MARVPARTRDNRAPGRLPTQSAMNIVNPWLLIGLTGLAIPLVIHWLMREHPRPVLLPTIVFVRQAMLRSHRRRKLTGLLLLAARLLLVTVLALLVARPVWMHSPFVTRSNQPLAAAMILDDAFYSRCRVAGRPLLQQAKESAWRHLDQLPPGSLAACLSSCQHDAELTHDLEFVRSSVARLTPQNRRADLQGAIERAGRLLARQAGPLPRIIVVASDFNLGLWPEDQARFRAPAGTRLRFVRLPPRPGGAYLRDVTAVNGSRLVTHREIRIEGVVGGPEAAGKRLTLELDGRILGACSVGAPDAAGQRRIALTTTLDRPGPTAARLRLHAADELQPDNDWHLVFNVHPPTTVLCLDGPASSPLPASEILALALAPPGWLGRQRFDVHVRQVDPDQDFTDLERFDGIVLTGPCQLSPGQWVALVDAVRRGGGLLIMPDHRTDAGRLNAGAPPLLPGRAVFRHTSPPDALLPLAETGLAAALAELGDGALLQLPFRAGYQLLADGTEAAHTVPILAWRSGGWALASRQLERGRCLFAGFAPVAAWSDLQTQDVFAPVIHRLLETLTAKPAVPGQVFCGDRLPLPASPPLPGDGHLVLHLPTGGGAIRLAAGDAAASPLQAATPGIYRVEHDGRPIAAYAANIPRRDHDYTYPPETAFAKLRQAGIAVVTPREPLTLATRQGRGPLPLAPLLTALFAILLPVEACLGLRYTRHA
jgi:hypothetical protein